MDAEQGDPLLITFQLRPCTCQALGQFGDLDPCYDPHGDLAIIELDRDIPAEEGTPICMPKRNETLQKKLTAVGYGQIRPNPNGTVLNYLQSVSVDFANVTEANKVFTTITKGRSICRVSSMSSSIPFQMKKQSMVRFFTRDVGICAIIAFVMEFNIFTVITPQLRGRVRERAPKCSQGSVLQQLLHQD
ncbi:hypothetical protein COOONC_19547 [Cooperia oncophora]